MPSPTPLHTGPTDATADVSDQLELHDLHELRDLLAKLVKGERSADDVLTKIVSRTSQQPSINQLAIDGATVDLGRESRCGFGEVIYGEGKPGELITRIAKSQIDVGQNVLVTRITQQAAECVQNAFSTSLPKSIQHNPVAHTLRISPKEISASCPMDSQQLRVTPHVAVVTAGSTDAPVAQEAMETLTWMGIPFQQFDDIGVAGPQRLLAAVARLRLASAVIVVAGMEGALPSVVGGHLAAPIFAVPTSVGYGVTLGGLTPLLGMLSSCASSVAVVNIDAGFKGGYMAGLVIDQIRKAVNGICHE